MSLFRDFNNLIRGTTYIYMLIDDDDFSINQSYNSLSIGTYDGMYAPGGFFTKFIVKNRTTINGEHYIQSQFPKSTRDLRVFKIPESNEEYTAFVNLIESYKIGHSINEQSREIIEKLKSGQNPLNVNNLSYIQGQQASQTARRSDTIDLTHSDEDEDEECPICLSPLDNTAITTRCGHKFHANCIRQVVNKKCPICRQITTPYRGGKTKRKKTLTKIKSTIKRKIKKRHASRKNVKSKKRNNK